MMNILQLQDTLKNFSQDQLVSEMQMPSGQVPQYLILSEIKRRKAMEDSYNEQSQPSDTTVAEDAISAAGMPQEGLPGMAQAMAPQTDMAMNTGATPDQAMPAPPAPPPMAEAMPQGVPQGMPQEMGQGIASMAKGGYVKRYAPGGTIVQNGVAYTIDPETGRMTDSAGNPIPTAIAMQIAQGSPGMADAFRQEAGGPQNIGEVGDLMDYLVTNRAAPPAVSPSVTAPQTPVSGGAVNRALTPAGYTSGAIDRTGPSSLPYFDASMGDTIYTADGRATGIGPTSPAVTGPIPRGVGQMGEEAARLPTSMIDPSLNPGYAARPGQPVAPIVDNGFSVYGGDNMDPRLAEILQMSQRQAPSLAEPVFDARTPGPQNGRPNNGKPSTPTELGWGSGAAVPSASLDEGPFDPSALPPVRDQTQGPMGEIYLGDVAMPPSLDLAPRGRAADPLAVAAERAIVGPRGVIMPPEQRELPIDPRLSIPVSQNIQSLISPDEQLAENALSDIALSFGSAIPAADTGTPMPAEGLLSLGEAVPTGATPMNPVSGQQSQAGQDQSTPGGGGSGGNGTPGASSIDQQIMDMLRERETRAEKDKWLALAQAGFALMSSTQPTLGGALGEAGQVGVGMMQQAQDSYEEAKMGLLQYQQEQQAARAAAAARASRGSGSGSGSGPASIDPLDAGRIIDANRDALRVGFGIGEDFIAGTNDLGEPIIRTKLLSDLTEEEMAAATPYVQAISQLGAINNPVFNATSG